MSLGEGEEASADVQEFDAICGGSVVRPGQQLEDGAQHFLEDLPDPDSDRVHVLLRLLLDFLQFPGALAREIAEFGEVLVFLLQKRRI